MIHQNFNQLSAVIIFINENFRNENEKWEASLQSTLISVLEDNDK